MSERMRSARARRVGFEKERGVLAVYVEDGLSFVRVELDARGAPAESAAQVLRLLAERGLCIRFLKIHRDCLSFVVAGESLQRAQEALAAAGRPLQVLERCSVVTVVAPYMRSIPSVMARMGEALYGCGIEVYQTADSHSSVSCVVPGERMADAQAVLRGEFGLADDVG